MRSTSCFYKDHIYQQLQIFVMQPQYFEQNYYQGYEPNPYINFLEAKDYTDFTSILDTFPHLKNINQPLKLENNINGLIIRSANDDNVHKAVKYGIWTTTPKNRIKLQQLWQRNQSKNPPHETYLFFSAVKSGMFEGVARLTSGFYDQTFPYWWENHTLKFKGIFKIEWVYLKDVNYKHFEGLKNMDKMDVTMSKDCDMIDTQTTQAMLKIFAQRPIKRTIFMDFKYMDDRQNNYIRPLYQYATRSMMMQQMPVQMNYQMQFMQPNQQMPYMKPEINKNNNLGFQMNPVSKNRKK